MKTTEELIHEIKTSKNIDNYFTENENELYTKTLAEVLKEWLKIKNLKKIDVINRGDLERKYAYQLFSGKRQPTRDKAIAIAVGLELDVDEVQLFMKQAGYGILYPRNRRDALILSAFVKKQTVIEINILLSDNKEVCLK